MAASSESTPSSSSSTLTRRAISSNPSPSKEETKRQKEEGEKKKGTTTPFLSLSSSKLQFQRRIFVEPLEECGKNQKLIPKIIALITATFFSSWFLILMIIGVAALFSRVWLAVFLFLLLSVKFPAQVFWPGFLNSFLFRYWRQYFSMSFVLEEDMEADKHYVLAEFPHGVIPWSQIVCASITDKLWPGKKIYAISSSTMFVIPLFKHFMSWIGCEPATAKNFLRLLKKGTTAVVVGGLAEMYTCFREKEFMIGYRKGFVKIAVESGAPIVPVYHFGVSQTLSAVGGRESFLSLEKLSRKTFFSFLMPYGRWGLPVPRPNPLMMVVGRAIPVEKRERGEKGFEEEVDRVHALVLEELARIYKEYRGVYSEEWKNRPLEIEVGPKQEVRVIT